MESRSPTIVEPTTDEEVRAWMHGRQAALRSWHGRLAAAEKRGHHAPYALARLPNGHTLIIMRFKEPAA